MGKMGKCGNTVSYMNEKPKKITVQCYRKTKSCLDSKFNEVNVQMQTPEMKPAI